MDMGIAGRRALLTGASRGMGLACATALAGEGVEVTIVARNEETLCRAARHIEVATGTRVAFVAADITTDEGRRKALGACPQPDILLNNAGGFPPGDFRDWDRNTWIAAIDLMMLPPILMIREVFDGMMERGFGRIVNIASRSVKIAQPEMGLSNGARSGLVGFMAGIARAGTYRGVTVNTLLPGIFDTDAQRDHVAALAAETGRGFDEIWNERAAGNPARRYGRAEEIAAYFTFLCSVHAGFITGQNLMIDGGSYPGTY
ncbi:MAG: SDR family oxidoreductase [Geminicoccaceae bacterium]|nr:SDR family oxidoreductase [Geminicoccaceae bacterium]